jgi:hypothetical protein
MAPLLVDVDWSNHAICWAYSWELIKYNWRFGSYGLWFNIFKNSSFAASIMGKVCHNISINKTEE